MAAALERALFARRGLGGAAISVELQKRCLNNFPHLGSGPRRVQEVGNGFVVRHLGELEWMERDGE